VIFGESNRGNVYNLLRQIASGRFLMVGNGRNRKSMAYVRNFSRFLVTMLANSPGVHLYNYADKPDFTMEQLVSLVHRTLPNGQRLNFRIPYTLGLSGGYLFDALAVATGKTFPISAIRIKKFCADTRINADKVKNTGFNAPYPLSEGLYRMIRSEFHPLLKERSLIKNES
jgi:nucleoside-diphosphate-sugar epimerase